MTLMPVSNISVLDSSWSNGGALAVDRPALGDVERLAVGTSSDSPRALKTWPLVTSPTGTVIGAPVSVTARAAHQTVGRLQRDGADHVVADVLRDLQGEHAAIRLALPLVGGELESTVSAL